MMDKPTSRPPLVLPVVLAILILFGFVALAFAVGGSTARPSQALAQALPTDGVEDTPEPTPTPLAPIDQLDVLSLAGVGYGAVVVKQDPLSLNGAANSSTIPDVLLTISNPISVTEAITATPGISDTTGVTTTTSLSSDIYQDHSGLVLLRWDATNQQWSSTWQTSEQVTGHAAPLPSAQQAGDPDASLLSAWQGKTLLHDNRPIFLLRTYSEPAPGSSAPTVQLRLYAWNGTAADPVKVAGAVNNDNVITATSDVEPVDLDNDGIYEIVADSGTSTTIYKWDGSQYVAQKAGGS